MRAAVAGMHYFHVPRPPRLVLPGIPHHITQRGNYRQKTYFRAEDYQLYLDLLLDYSRHYGASILGYCLMPNHVHLVAIPHREDSFARIRADCETIVGVYETLWQRLRRAFHAARGGMRQRITLSGLGYTLATVVVGVAAFLTANNLLFLILAALLGTLMVAGGNRGQLAAGAGFCLEKFAYRRNYKTRKPSQRRENGKLETIEATTIRISSKKDQLTPGTDRDDAPVVGTAIADRPLAQIRMGGTTAYGSYLGYVAANRPSG